MCFFKVKHYFGHISGMVGPIDVKWKGSALLGYWVQYVTLTFDLTHDHTHDLDLGVSRSESEIALSQEWGGQLTMNEKMSHPFMTMILTCVTMVGWADVLDNDRGDFRRRRAVVISSFGYIAKSLSILKIECWHLCASGITNLDQHRYR